MAELMCPFYNFLDVLPAWEDALLFVDSQPWLKLQLQVEP